jgi:phosphoserine phosphatase RsbX
MEVDDVPEADCHLIRTALTGRDDECGDTGFVREYDGEVFLALVDALGHGRLAHEIALRAEDYLTRNYRESLTMILQGLHTFLQGSGGAVAACGRLALATGELKYAAVGNITVRVLGPHATRFVARDGILGYSICSPREETFQLSPGDVLVMYSDGVQEHFDAWECASLLGGSAQSIAANLLRRFGKNTDDASCLVLRYLP